MLIKTLVENHSVSENLQSQHGLSLYIKTQKHKILFDLGQDRLFLENAKKMNIDLEDVDIVIISHGHYDHGGGLKAFLEINNTAKVYIHEKAFEEHFSLRSKDNLAYIGLEESLKEVPQIIFTKDYLFIDEELELFSNIKGKSLCSQGNKALFVKRGEKKVEDTFMHEQNLIITQKDKCMLFAGCAHKGIVNIMEEGKALKNKVFDYVIGGFHLFNHSKKQTENLQLVEQIGHYLKETNARCYTCHCTGDEAFSKLQEIMQDKISYLATGSVVEI